jgi:spore coat polysaccharide biosynthesis protein SpsF (cytidylyltransferase family)
MIIGALIVARLSSSRLPQKNILPILGKPMIQHLAERISKSKYIDKIIFATSNLESDDPLEELAKNMGIGCYRGDLDNVMERICGAAESFRCDTIVEILGDNPLVHSDLIDDVINLYLTNKLDYAANITKEYAPYIHQKKLFSIGLRVQVYSSKIARQYIDFPEYLENGKHPCAFIFDNPDRFNIGFIEAIGKWSFMNFPELNFAVNYPKNFDLVKKIYEKNYHVDNYFNLEAIYHQLENEPELNKLFGAE